MDCFGKAVHIRLNYHVLFVLRHFVVKEKVFLSVLEGPVFGDFYHLVSQLEGVFADVTGQLLPVVGVDAIQFLALLLGIEPGADALDVDELGGALALARSDERVLVIVFFFKADATALARLKGKVVIGLGS